MRQWTPPQAPNGPSEVFDRLDFNACLMPTLRTDSFLVVHAYQCQLHLDRIPLKHWLILST